MCCPLRTQRIGIEDFNWKKSAITLISITGLTVLKNIQMGTLSEKVQQVIVYMS